MFSRVLGVLEIYRTESGDLLPNQALYQAEPHPDVSLFALRALPVVTTPLSSQAKLARHSASHGHSLILAVSAPGGARNAPQLRYIPIERNGEGCSFIIADFFHSVKRKSRGGEGGFLPFA